MTTRYDPETGLALRGTSNGNERGSAEDRRRRRAWLLVTYRANEDVLRVQTATGGWVYYAWPPNTPEPFERFGDAPVEVVHACRCYRCGQLLTDETLTVDRIIPGALGGTYRRNNIRPACGPCNSETGGPLSRVRKPRRKAPR